MTTLDSKIDGEEVRSRMEEKAKGFKDRQARWPTWEELAGWYGIHVYNQDMNRERAKDEFEEYAKAVLDGNE